MTNEKPRAKDDPSLAPESGTPRDETSGNKPSDRANDPRAIQGGGARQTAGAGQKDDPSVAGEER